MPVNFNDFNAGATVNLNDQIVGFNNTNIGGERKWRVATLSALYLSQGGNTYSTNLSVGTRDDNDLVFLRNNIRAARISTNGFSINTDFAQANHALTIAGNLSASGVMRSLATYTGELYTGTLTALGISINTDFAQPNHALTVAGSLSASGVMRAVAMELGNSFSDPIEGGAITLLDPRYSSSNNGGWEIDNFSRQLRFFRDKPVGQLSNAFTITTAGDVGIATPWAVPKCRLDLGQSFDEPVISMWSDNSGIYGFGVGNAVKPDNTVLDIFSWSNGTTISGDIAFGVGHYQSGPPLPPSDNSNFRFREIGRFRGDDSSLRISGDYYSRNNIIKPLMEGTSIKIDNDSFPNFTKISVKPSEEDAFYSSFWR